MSLFLSFRVSPGQHCPKDGTLTIPESPTSEEEDSMGRGRGGTEAYQDPGLLS